MHKAIRFNPAACARETDSLIVQGQPDTARDLLLSAWMTAEGKKPVIAVKLARAHRLCRDAALASRVLDEAATLWPVHLGIATERAKCMLAEGQTTDAIRVLEETVLRPDTPLTIWLLLAKTYCSERAWDNALHAIDRAEAQFSPSSLLAIQRASALSRAGRRDEALKEVKSALARWPEAAELRYLLAQQLVAAQQYDECIDLLSPAIAADASAMDEIGLLAQACIYAGRLEELLKFFADARYNWQDHGRASVFALLLVECRSLLGLPAQATDESSCELSDAAREDCRNYATALRESQHPEAAERLIARAIEQDPKATRLQGVSLLASFHSRHAEPDLALFHRLYAAGQLDSRDIPNLVQLLTSWDSAALSVDLLLEVLDRTANDTLRATLAMSLAESVLEHGDVHGAVALAKRSAITSLDREQSLRLRRLYGALQLEMPTGLDVVGIFPDDTLEDGHITHYRFGETTCVVWFAGVIRQTQAFVETECLPIWKQLGISVFFVHDQKRLSSAWGFGRYFPDRERAADAIANALRNAGYSRVITCGTSLSGYSAMLYGGQLGALGALSFSGTCYIPTVEDMPDSRGVLSLRRLRRVMNLDLADDQEVAPYLRQHPQLLVHHHFGKQSAFDVGQSARIAPLANVRCFPADHDQHASLLWLHENGQLENAIKQFVAELR